MLYAASMSQFEILPCPRAEIKEAFRCLHRGVSTDQQDALVATLDQLRGQAGSVGDGLFIARCRGQIVAATWVQSAPGNTALLWPPDFASPAAPELMRFVDSILNRWRVPLAQMIIGSESVVDLDLLALAGFHYLVDLDYLALENTKFETNWPDGKLYFEPQAANHSPRLQNILLKSYEGTLDCPQLNDVRDPEDVIASYEAQGKYAEDNWFLVQLDRQDVGVLILAEHDRGNVLELVYMGIIPAMRGRSLGREVLRHAIRRAVDIRAERLVLAVDTQNAPAQEMYRRAGFALWDRRTVYARILVNETASDR